MSFWSQFVAMIYARLSGVQSLREPATAPASHSNLSRHLGLQAVRRSTLSDASRDRPTAQFAAAFELLLPGLTGAPGRGARDLVRLIDAASLRLSDGLCGGARFGAGTAGAKLHRVYDPQARCPTYSSVTAARVDGIVAAEVRPIEPGAPDGFDRADYAFGWRAALDARGCRFVTRLTATSPARLIQPLPVTDEAIRSARLIRRNRRMAASGKNPFRGTPREIVVAPGDGETWRLVTNDAQAPAGEIAGLYKMRRQIELFFGWVKQNLRIKKFLGASENAVRLQIITALIAFLPVRIAHQSWPDGKRSLQDLTRLVRANRMHRKSRHDLLRPPPPRRKDAGSHLVMAPARA